MQILGPLMQILVMQILGPLMQILEHPTPQILGHPDVGADFTYLQPQVVREHLFHQIP
jgi:hypothetical protein